MLDRRRDNTKNRSNSEFFFFFSFRYRAEILDNCGPTRLSFSRTNLEIVPRIWNIQTDWNVVERWKVFTVDRADIDSRLNIVSRNSRETRILQWWLDLFEWKLVFETCCIHVAVSSLWNRMRICRSVIQVDVRQNHIVVFVTSLRNFVTKDIFVPINRISKRTRIKKYVSFAKNKDDKSFNNVSCYFWNETRRMTREKIRSLILYPKSFVIRNRTQQNSKYCKMYATLLWIFNYSKYSKRRYKILRDQIEKSVDRKSNRVFNNIEYTKLFHITIIPSSNKVLSIPASIIHHAVTQIFLYSLAD